MDKKSKKRIGKVIGLITAAAVVAGLAAMPLLAQQADDTDGPQASILSDRVQTRDITVALAGGGTLTQMDEQAISIHKEVKLTNFLVSNADTVKTGDPIAEVDRVSVMTAIAQVQQTLEYLSEELEAAAEEETASEVVALAGGTVKKLYAQEGDSVQDVMLRDGALAVLSLDGLMAVDFETAKDAPVGTQVTLRFEDGTEAQGKVAKNLAGAVTVTLEDDDYEPGQKVYVSADDTRLGSGQLYIYSPWNAVAYTGTVEDIQVSEGESVDAGQTLMELEGAGQSGTYRQLLNQRQKYEKLMQELFVMYQTRQITAPCDGVVSGVDTESAQLLSAGAGEYKLTLLANAPNGDDETQYTNFIGQVTAVTGGSWAVNINPQPVEVTDYKDLSTVPMDTGAMTQPVEFAANVPVYALSAGEWTQIGTDSVAAGDILLFAGDASGNFVWVVRVGNAPLPSQPEEPTEPTEPVEPSEPADPTQPTEPGGPTEPTEPGEPTEPTEPGGPTDPSQPADPTRPGTPTTPTRPSGGTGSGFTYPSTGSGQTVIPQPEEVFEPFSMDVTQIAAVTPQDAMELEITVDELDVLQLQVGQMARVKFNALGGQSVDAVITDIANTGSNNGGNSKFTVELTMEKTADMLPGMQGAVTIDLQTVTAAPSLPVKALVEVGTKTCVYTGFDEENQILTDPVEVTVGVSDGEHCQILSGLTEGSLCYYAYYDTLEISNVPDFGGGFSLLG